MPKRSHIESEAMWRLGHPHAPASARQLGEMLGETRQTGRG